MFVSEKDLQTPGDTNKPSKLDVPARLAYKIIKYSFIYGIYSPIALSIRIMLEPFLLTYYAITIPLKFFFRPIINPVSLFIGREIAKKENLAMRLALESMSYGSGATAKGISEAMQLAMNGMVKLFNDIGLPAANNAEKFSLLTDQKAKSRSKRSITDAVGTLGSGVTQIIKFPFLLIKGIFTLPFRIIYYVIRWPFSFFFGGEKSTYTLLLTDMSTERITHMVLTATWKFMRDTGFSQLNTFATKLKDNNGVPEQFRTLLSEYTAIYNVMKMLKYVN